MKKTEHHNDVLLTSVLVILKPTMDFYEGCSINIETVFITFDLPSIGIKVNIFVKYNLFPTTCPNCMCL